MLQFIPYCYKTLQMCKTEVDYYPHTLEDVSDCSVTQEMWKKSVDTYIILH